MEIEGSAARQQDVLDKRNFIDMWKMEIWRIVEEIFKFFKWKWRKMRWKFNLKRNEKLKGLYACDVKQKKFEMVFFII